MDKDHLGYFDTHDVSRMLGRYISSQSFNQSTELIKQNKRDIHSKVFYVFSLVFGVFLSLVSSYIGWVALLGGLNVFAIILVYQAKKFSERRIALAKDHEKIRLNLKEWGINIQPL